MFNKTLYNYLYQFLAKEHKTADDWKGYYEYLVELMVVGGLIGLGISKLIDVIAEQYEDYKKSIAAQQQKEITESINE